MISPRRGASRLSVNMVNGDEKCVIAVYTDDARRKVVRATRATTARDVVDTVAQWFPCDVDGCYLIEKNGSVERRIGM